MEGQYGEGVPQANGDSSKDWMAYVGLAGGILAWISTCIVMILPFLGICSLIFGIVGVVFGILGIKSSQRTLSIIGLVLSVLYVGLAIIGGCILLILYSGYIFYIIKFAY